MLSCYPQTAYTGFLKLIVFTLIPAAMAGYLPVELVRRGEIGAFIAGTAGVVGVALMIFSVGLRRYSSGNRMAAGI